MSTEDLETEPEEAYLDFDEADYEPELPERDWRVALGMSLVFGLGYLYLGRPWRFAVVLGLACLLVFMLHHGLWGWMSHPLVFVGLLALAALGVLLAACDIYMLALARSHVPAKWYDHTWAYAVFGIIGLAPIVLFFALGGRGEMATRIFAVQLGANTPTIQIGDHVVANMNAYENEDPKRGDLVRYKVKADADEFYFLRVIGLPGETISFNRGTVLINGTPIARGQAGTFEGAHYQGDSIFVETLPRGLSYNTLMSSTPLLEHDGKRFDVPQGHYFLLGDNRDSSWDSRSLKGHGYIPRENIFGRAGGVVFSSNLKRIGAWFN